MSMEMSTLYTYQAGDATLWDHGVVTDLGRLPSATSSSASAITQSGQVVGSSGGRAFLWANGVMADLNSLVTPSSGWSLRSATGIHPTGQIVGNGTLNGYDRAFLLLPGDPSEMIGFAVSGISSPTTAGASSSFTVTAMNAQGQPASGYTGTIHFTSSDGRAVLPLDYT